MNVTTNRARLVKGKTRWYILFYWIPLGETKRKRERETCGLNRIHNLKERERTGLIVVKLINELLIKGEYPRPTQKQIDLAIWAAENPEKKLERNIALQDGINLARDIKATSDRELSNKSYRSMNNIFLNWLKKEGIELSQARQFNAHFAHDFMDHCVRDRKVCNTTFNNYSTCVFIS